MVEVHVQVGNEELGNDNHDDSVNCEGDNVVPKSVEQRKLAW